MTAKTKLQTIGVLGGGQLARMLLLAGYPVGIAGRVLASSKDEPAAQVCGDTIVAPLDQAASFFTGLSAVTFESEFVNLEVLGKVLPRKLAVFPSLKAIAQIQDRLMQKQLLDRFKIATAAWIEVRDDLTQAEQKFGKFVLKQRRFGYDGHGTFINPRKLPPTTSGFIAESLVPFRRELAVSFVRSKTGKFVSLPLVESVQVDSRCFSVKGPVHHPDLAHVTRAFKKLMEAIDYVGILAVELFDVNSRLIVNELAPRVHNSAHYSQDALECGQFEYHLRAGLGLALPTVKLRAPGFAMVNLLGRGGRIELKRQGPGFLHWYGKAENRKGRKLGHLNVLARTPNQALKRALAWEKEFTL